MLKYGFTSTYDFVTHFLTTKQPRTTQILDPLTVMIRLSILFFKKKGTKLSIQNHILQFNEPDFLQGTIRWTRGDQRTDLHNLKNPIIKASEWYDVNDIPTIKNIFIFAEKGLKKLISAYSNEENNSSQIICDCLKHYTTIIKRCLDPKMATKSFIQAKNKSKDDEMYKKLKDIWTIEEINIVNELLIMAEKRYQHKDRFDSFIKSIEILLIEKENKVQEIIRKHLITL